MTVFRISKALYIHDLTGTGARIAGGRWNSKGVPLLYTSSSRALCTAEVAVHLPLGIVPIDFSIATILIPDSIHIASLDTKKLPSGWDTFPPLKGTQKLGDKFIFESKYIVLKVPSAIVPGDFNYLINPLHPDIKKIKIKTTESYNFNDRLFKR